MNLFETIFRKLIRDPQVSKVYFGRPTRIQELGQTWYYSTTSILVNGKLISGYSVDGNYNLSQIKSGFECLERAALVLSDKKPLASAAHYRPKVLATKLLNEALERDSLICWALGIISPESISKLETHFELTLPTAKPGFKTSVAARAMQDCYAFGSACSDDRFAASTRAKAELVMSLQRHRNKNCKEVITDHDLMHRRTATEAFKNALQRRDLKMPERKIELDIHRLDSVARWPVKVMIAESADLFRWDPRLSEQLYPHQNRILSARFGVEEPSIANLFAG